MGDPTIGGCVVGDPTIGSCVVGDPTIGGCDVSDPTTGGCVGGAYVGSWNGGHWNVGLPEGGGGQTTFPIMQKANATPKKFMIDRSV